MKKNHILAILIVLLICIAVYKNFESRSLIEKINEVVQIRVYDERTDRSVTIENKEEMKKYLEKWQKIIVRRERLAWNGYPKGIMVGTYNKNGDVLETFYFDDSFIVQYHWRLKIIQGNNPYDELMARSIKKQLETILNSERID